MKLLTTLTLALSLAAVSACKKSADKAPDPVTGSGSAVVGSGSDMAPTPDADTAVVAGSGSAAAGSGSAAAPAEDPNADYITVYAVHAKPKPDDPVAVKFAKFTVTKAAFDPKKLEGGTASLAIDLASLSSGSEKRDGHLKTPDYIDVTKFTTATVDIADVKKKDDTHYTANAKVKLRDLEKTYPVEFEVLGTTDDSVRVKAAQKFPRQDFKIGNDAPDQGVGNELEIKVQLTLKKT